MECGGREFRPCKSLHYQRSLLKCLFRSIDTRYGCFMLLYVWRIRLSLEGAQPVLLHQPPNRGRELRPWDNNACARRNNRERQWYIVWVDLNNISDSLKVVFFRYHIQTLDVHCFSFEKSFSLSCSSFKTVERGSTSYHFIRNLVSLMLKRTLTIQI